MARTMWIGAGKHHFDDIEYKGCTIVAFVHVLRVLMYSIGLCVDNPSPRARIMRGWPLRVHRG